MSKKSELTIEDLLALGMSLEDIVNNKQPEAINVNFDPSEFSAIVERVAESNVATLEQIKALMAKNQEQSNSFMNKTLTLLAKQVKDSNKEEKPIKGIKVVRNKDKLIDSLQLIR